MGDDNVLSQQDRRGRGHNKKQNNKKWIYILIAAVISIIVIVGAYFVYVDNKVKSWDNKIYKGVTINGIDVSGQTKEVAEKIVADKLTTKINNKTITLSSDGKSVVFEYKEIDPKYEVDKAVNEALAEGKSGNLFEKDSCIKNGIIKNITVEFGYNKELMNKYLDELNSKVTVKPKNADLKVNSGEITIIPQVDGVLLDLAKSSEILNQDINHDLNTTSEVISLPVEKVDPKITDSELESVNSEIGTATTHFKVSDVNKATNLRLVMGRVNGTLLMPGQTFSYNQIVGERTIERGFKDGGTFVGNKVVQTIGGGVCQGSTTLYQAVANAGILSTERHNHSMNVTYSKQSEDAAVAWGYLDYKFKNTYNSPIFITGYVGSTSMTFNIYGNKSDLKGCTYKIVGVSTGQGTSNGYFVTYKDGKEISRVKVSSDVYA